MTVFSDSLSWDSLDSRRVLIAPRTKASVGTDDKDENTNLVVTVAAPVTLVDNALGVFEVSGCKLEVL